MTENNDERYLGAQASCLHVSWRARFENMQAGCLRSQADEVIKGD
jgi:hypothetical protein